MRNAPTIHTLSTHNIYPQYIQLYILWVYIVGALYILWVYIVGANVVAPTIYTDLYILWVQRIYCGQQNGKLHPQYIRLHPQYICMHPQYIPTIHTAVCIVGIYCGCIHMYCGCKRIYCGCNLPFCCPQYIRCTHNIYRSVYIVGATTFAPTIYTHNIYKAPTIYTHNIYSCIYCGYMLWVLNVCIVGAFLMYMLWVRPSFTDEYTNFS